MEAIVRVIYQHVDASVVRVFTIQHQFVVMLNTVPIRVLVSLALLVHQQIPLVVVMELFVHDKIDF